MGVMIAPVEGSGSWPAWRQMVLKRALVLSFTALIISEVNLMPPKTLPGRAIIIGLAIKGLDFIAARLLGGLPSFLGVVDTVAGIAIVIGAGYFAFQLVVLAKRRLLWRVRR